MVKNLQRATAELKRNLSVAPVIPVIGNNDVFPHNSLALNSSDPFLRELARLWAPWLDEEQQNSFQLGAYYSASPIPGLRIIVLNTLYYYTKFCPYSTPAEKIQFCKPADLSEDKIPDDPAGQFEWLTDQLNTARNNGEK